MYPETFFGHHLVAAKRTRHPFVATGFIGKQAWNLVTILSEMNVAGGCSGVVVWFEQTRRVRSPEKRPPRTMAAQKFIVVVVYG